MDMIGLLNKILHVNSRTKVRIDEDACSGCGKCVKICPQLFVMDDHSAVLMPHADPDQFKKACKKAAKACSLGAIIIE